MRDCTTINTIQINYERYIKTSVSLRGGWKNQQGITIPACHEGSAGR
ncbi:MAG: hypothetical protein MZV64_05285 [Ignavibacteriales bacterium]|nr:hypothetical protein [Ignavibacteriales bacterium]